MRLSPQCQVGAVAAHPTQYFKDNATTLLSDPNDKSLTEFYDFRKDTWTPGPLLPNNNVVERGCAGFLGNQGLFAGGRWSDQVQLYDHEMATFTVIHTFDYVN